MCPTNSEQIVAVDSHIATYFVRAERDSRPQSNDLEREYKAVYEIALTYGFWLLPKVEEELQKIPNAADRLQHDQSLIQLFRITNLRESSQIESRTKELLNWHNDENDCRILAEAEALEANILLTFDGDFQKRLNPHARIKLVKPSQLKIPAGTPHKFRREN